MSEQYKEPETLKIAPSEEGSSPDDHGVGESSDNNPVLVENKEREANPATLLNRDPYIGTILNSRYRVVSLIGKGGSSAVYKGEDTTLNQPVAIKILHGHLASDATITRRFEQESKTARLLRHPNIVDVRAYDKTESGIPFLVMDLVEGTSLQEAIKTSGCLPVQRTIEIFTQVCAALAVAHEKGIVHRDLKPGNIMLSTSADGSLRVKVLDFGIAKILPATGDTVMKLTQTGEMLGSILYMSPEQCLDKDLDGRSDCYSLGCVMYETLTGKPPLTARTAFETMNKHMAETPARLDKVRPDLKRSPGLQYLVSKAMAKDPNQRYQEITHLQDDLQQLADGIAFPLNHLDERKMAEIAGEKTSSVPLSRSNKFEKHLPKHLAILRPEHRLIVVLSLLSSWALIASATDNNLAMFLLFLIPTVILSSIIWFAIHAPGKRIVFNRETTVEPPPLFPGTSKIPISIKRVELVQSMKSPDQFDIYIAPHSNHHFRKLRIQPKNNDHSSAWMGLCIASGIDKTIMLPAEAEVRVDARGEPLNVVFGGASARVLSESM